jgi:hypothetical protein
MPAVKSAIVTFADHPAAQGAFAASGWSARGAALASIGISGERGIQYEAAVKAEKVLVTARSTPEEMARALIFADSARVKRKIIGCGRRAIREQFYVYFAFCKYTMEYQQPTVSRSH